MPLTRFPNGVSSFGMPVLGMGDETITTGNVFFVDSGATNASDSNDAKSPSRPAATIDGCIAKCTANNGDIIFVMPGHDENPTTSITMDVAGVWIRGLGWGASRPTVTFGALAATVSITAASCRISNIVFDLGTVATTVTDCFNITGADCIVENCETIPHATSQFTNFMTTTAAAVRLVLRNNRFRGLAAASNTTGLTLVGCDDLVMVGNEVSGHFTTGGVAQITTAANRVTIVHNLLVNHSTTAGDYVIDLHDSTTGLVAYNAIGGNIALATNVDWGACSCVENYVADTTDVTGVVIPATAAA